MSFGLLDQNSESDPPADESPSFDPPESIVTQTSFLPDKTLYPSLDPIAFQTPENFDPIFETSVRPIDYEGMLKLDDLSDNRETHSDSAGQESLSDGEGMQSMPDVSSPDYGSSIPGTSSCGDESLKPPHGNTSHSNDSDWDPLNSNWSRTDSELLMPSNSSAVYTDPSSFSSGMDSSFQVDGFGALVPSFYPAPYFRNPEPYPYAEPFISNFYGASGMTPMVNTAGSAFDESKTARENHVIAFTDSFSGNGCANTESFAFPRCLHAGDSHEPRHSLFNNAILNTNATADTLSHLSWRHRRARFQQPVNFSACSFAGPNSDHQATSSHHASWAAGTFPGTRFGYVSSA